jgi:hypothetical protein
VQSTDNGQTIIPVPIHLPHAQNCSDQLDVSSMANLGHTSHHLTISDLEKLHQELTRKGHPSSHHRFDIMNAMQEHLCEPPPVRAYPSEPKAGSFNTEPYQVFGLPCDDLIQPGRTFPSSPSDDGSLMDSSSFPTDNLFPYHRPFLVEYVKFGSGTEGSTLEANPSGGMATMSTQVSGTFDPGHHDDPMTPPIQDGEPSQF